MRKILSLILALLLSVSITACGINSSVVSKREAVNLDDSGIVNSDTIKSIKDDNSIGVFCGMSDDIKYEWKLFGSKIVEVRDINLKIEVTENEDSVTVIFNNKETFDFAPMLSMYLNIKWKSLNANIFKDGKQIGTAELTGTDKTIINFTVSDAPREYVIKPSEEKQAETVGSEISSNSQTSSTEEKINNTTEKNNAVTFSETKSETQNTSSKSTSTNEKKETTSNSSSREVSSGNGKEQDKYLTDPVPEGKPLPVEPEDASVDKNTVYHCTFSIECSTIFNNLSDLDPNKLGELPSDGFILKKQVVAFYEGESVFDVLKRICKENKIHMESSFTPMYNSAYVEGINNLYEFDCGSLSGWMYRVDGWYPNYGCSRYQLCDGENIEWRYTCDLGKDVGCDWMA